MRPDLMPEWAADKNGALTPEMFTVGSNQKVWWRCAKGHTWRSQIKVRTQGHGCPVCSGKRLQAGENDLATLRPDVAAQWDSERNGALTPADVRPGIKRKVWWKCGCGHEWQASVTSRVSGAGCPDSANRVIHPGENDLAALYPALAQEWHPTKNGSLTPDQLLPNSNRLVWWRCPKGHDYRSIVAHRTTMGAGCPYCAGRKVLKGFNDLATVEPLLAAQWHPTLNQGLTPETVTRGSHKKVWWQCSEGHIWRAMIYSRTGKAKCGCPICAGRVNPRSDTRYRRTLEEQFRRTERAAQTPP